MRIIPAIDLIDGQCVRLSKGDYDTKKVYSKNPLEVAKEFEAHGIRYLHLVDLDGAKAKQIVNHRVLEDICKQTNMKVDFGGGIRSDDDLRIAFECGASQITGGSIAVSQPETFKRWLQEYGPDEIILGADCRQRKISTSAWKETTEWDVVDYIKQYELEDVSYVICTDISKDGMLQGTAIELYEEILEKTGVKLIASGGVSSMDDLMVLSKIGCEGVIIGKAIYEGRISLKQLSQLC